MKEDRGPLGSFSEKRHPYYIFAADFRDTSTGVNALHYLCHALNCAGESAYLMNTHISKPGLNVRFLTSTDCWHHKSSTVVPIVVYPEIVSDNPYNAVAVVRYMLNRDGFLTGRQIAKGPYDLTFYYSWQFVPENCPSPEMLEVPVLDDRLFAPPEEPVPRTRKYLFLSRINRAEVDVSAFPKDVELLDIQNPKTLQQLATVFQTAAVLYSYEVSATCTYAMLAGCPVIYIRNDSLQEIPLQDEFSSDGCAFMDEPGGLERAAGTVGRIRQHWQKIKDNFPQQLSNFVQKTQDLAVSMSEGNAYSAVHIMQRIFPNSSPPTLNPLEKTHRR